MSVKLLSSAKSGILLYPHPVSPWWQKVALVVGAIVILIGVADIAARTSNYLDAHVSVQAFAPLGTLELPHATTTTPIPPIAITTTKANAPVPFVPVTLRIASIDVNAKVESVALKDDKVTMATPKEFSNVAWYSPGAKPGEPGNAVFAGHLNSPILGTKGVFNKLSDVHVGDRIVVEGAKGEMFAYRVQDINEYVTAAAPTADIFKQTGPSQIVLITCEGKWDAKSKTFDKRLVVVARLLPV